MTGLDYPFISVVIPVRGKGGSLADCLAYCSRADYPFDKMEIIVADNAPSQDVRSLCCSYGAVYVQAGEYRGASWARNKGVEVSRGDYIAFIDDDCLPAVDCFSQLVRGFRDRRTGVCGGEFIDRRSSSLWNRYKSAGGEKQRRAFSGSTHVFPSLVTGNLMVRRDVIDVVGLFDVLFPYGSEDTDFIWRIYLSGFHVRYLPGALVYHVDAKMWTDHVARKFNFGVQHIRLMKKYAGYSQVRAGWDVGDLLNVVREISKGFCNLVFDMCDSKDWDLLFYRIFRVMDDGAWFLGCFYGWCMNVSGRLAATPVSSAGMRFVVGRSLNGVLTLSVLRHKRHFVLCPVASKIWFLFYQGLGLNKIKTVLMRDFEVEAHRAALDIEDFVTMLETEGLLSLPHEDVSGILESCMMDNNVLYEGSEKC